MHFKKKFAAYWGDFSHEHVQCSLPIQSVDSIYKSRTILRPFKTRLKVLRSVFISVRSLSVMKELCFVISQRISVRERWWWPLHCHKMIFELNLGWAADKWSNWDILAGKIGIFVRKYHCTTTSTASSSYRNNKCEVCGK